MNSRNLVFIALMASLGNVLSAISIRLSPIVPSIPLGPVSVSLALDLSHLTTFIAALYGGPIVGGMTGLIGGVVAAFEFGFSKGNMVTGLGLPLGKAMTGMAAGLVMGRMNLDRNKLMMVVSTVVSYIPEGVFTAFLFIFLFPPLFGLPSFVVSAIVTQIIVKAFVEMVVMGLVLTGITENQGFTDYVKGFFTERTL
jgi:hypothetical protein